MIKKQNHDEDYKETVSEFNMNKIRYPRQPPQELA